MWGAIIGAGISAAGSLMAAQKNNQNSSEMASNAVRTRVKDMRKAGINPILAVQGSGLGAAQVPVQQSPDFSSAGAVFDQLSRRQDSDSRASQADTAKSAQAQQAVQVASNVALQKAQAEQASASAELTRGQLSMQQNQNALLAAQILSEGARKGSYESSSNLSNATARKVMLDSAQSEVLARFLQTPEGRERAITNYSGNSTIGVFDTMLRRLGFVPSSSARGISDGHHLLSDETRRKLRGEGSSFVKPKSGGAQSVPPEVIYPVPLTRY